MFSAYCPRHGSEVLFGERRIRRLQNIDGVILVEVECYDGERITIVTGRGRRGPSSSAQLPG
ncbi:MAG: hypothetical protein DLM59_06375 [Pseudonocardiales bacterium]|nr:MAG: hypothetical protein DLM59_06375 [Pseudonocardiales bacterium]